MLNYQPIDYNSWNPDGTGKNILPHLSDIEREIWQKALPFQDKRNDKGHAEVATKFALDLTKLIEGDRNIVVPAIILHDVGYDIDPEKFREAFLSNPDKETQIRIRLEHQVRGCVIAYDVLREVGHTEYIPEILRINVDHDTRFYSTTMNGKIVQDADVLWRVTKPCIDAYLSNFPRKEIRRKSEESTIHLLNFQISKQIAEIELENAMKYFV